MADVPMKEVPVVALGKNGEGVVFVDGHKKFIPFAVPGDVARITLSVHGSSGKIGKSGEGKVELIPSGSRSNPVCVHFTQCGGCSLQHLTPDGYRNFKLARIEDSLKREGVVSDCIHDLIMLPSGVRRRTNFKVYKGRTGVQIGFHRRKSHQILPLRMCPLLLPSLVGLIPSFKKLFEGLLPQGGRADLFLLETNTGVDVAVEAQCLQDLKLNQLEQLAHFTTQEPISRIRVNDDLIVQNQVPTLNFSGIGVGVDAKKFCQVSDLSDLYLVDILKRFLTFPYEKAVDLFCGRGTFTFFLAQKATVHGYDVEADGLEALKKAARSMRIQVAQRNLFSQPLSAESLNAYDVAVINPPRAGAWAQSDNLAASQCPWICYVSCNPETFARDAGVLIKGGYRLTAVVPFDQFLWTEHVELVGFFSRS